MNLGFKRIMSSVLAFVMLFTSLVMVNVVNVSAADEVLDFSSNELIAALGATGGTLSKKTYTIDGSIFSIVSGGNRPIKDGHMEFGGSSDSVSFSTSSDSATVVIKAAARSSTSRINWTKGSAEYTGDSQYNPSKIDTTVRDYTFKLSTKGDYAFGGDSKLDLYKVTVTESGETPTPTTYTITMGNKDNTEWPDVTLDKDSTTTKGDTVNASWSANDKYQEGSQSITLDDSMLSGTEYTVPYSAITFTPIGGEQTEDSLLPISENGTYNLLEGLTASSDKEAISKDTLLAGNHFQAADGELTKRYSNNNVTSIETKAPSKNAARGVIKFTTTKNFKVSISFASTGNTNTSDIAVRTAGETDINKYVAHDSQLSTTYKDLVIKNLPAGTYEIYTPCLAEEQGGTNVGQPISRGTRLKEVKFEDPETDTEDSTESTSIEEEDSSETSTDAPVPSDNVWSAGNQNNLLGDALNNVKTSTDGDKSHDSEFEEHIFGDTGAILNQPYVTLSTDTGIIKPAKSGKLYLYAIAANNSAKDMKILDSQGTAVVTRNLEGKKGSKTIQPIIFDVTAGEEYALSDYNILVYYAKIVPSKTYNVKLSGTNNTTVTEITIGGVKVNIPASSAFSDISVELPEGTNTFSAEGCTFDPPSVNVTEEGQEISVTIDELKVVNAVFDLKEAKADGAITITQLNLGSDGKYADGTSQTLVNADTSVTFENIKAGTKFKIVAKDARNVYKWLAKRAGVVDSEKDGVDYNYQFKNDIKFFNGSSNKRYFIYTVPSNASSGEYGIQFTASENISSLEVDRNHNSHGTNLKDLEFGQYGFGNDKSDVCGKDAREYMSYEFEYAGLSDYCNYGYSADVYNGILTTFNGEAASVKKYNQFGILNKSKDGKKTYARFKVSDSVVSNDGGAINAIIDRTGKIKLQKVELQGDTYNVVDADIKSTDIYNSSGSSVTKQSFPIEAGCTYEIIADDSVTDEDTFYIKSIRILNPNNIFDTVDDSPNGTVPGTSGDVKKVTQLTPEEAGNITFADGAVPESSETVFRVIGQITLSGDDGASLDAANAYLASITAVGFDAYKESVYKEWDTDGKIEGNNHFNGNSTASGGGAKPEPDAVIAFSDILNTSIDLDGDGTADIGSSDASVFEQETVALYCQTFYAAKENMVLVPWVQYAGSTAKVYSLIPRTTTTTNNVVLTIQ